MKLKIKHRYAKMHNALLLLRLNNETLNQDNEILKITYDIQQQYINFLFDMGLLGSNPTVNWFAKKINPTLEGK